MHTAATLSEELLDAVYRCALEPHAWREVMLLLKQSLPSNAQTFYFLHRATRRLQPVCQSGVGSRWLQSFDALYFADDNPWIRLTQRLHQPGVVRTNERLDKHLLTHGALYQSAYYNDWMRPQGFKYTIGNTLLAEGGVVANITLMRPPDMPTFSAAEVRAFEVLSRHMTRALQLALRLERPEACPASIAAFEALPQAVAVVDAQRRLLHANGAMHALLRRRQPLLLHQGEVQASDAGAQARFAAYVAAVLCSVAGQPDVACTPLVLGFAQRQLNLHAMPVVGPMGSSLSTRPTVLLTATEPFGGQALSPAALRQRFGCTPSEARLVQLIAEGQPLQQAAVVLGITYSSARSCLKIVFDKTGARSQAQLVARVHQPGMRTARLL